MCGRFTPIPRPELQDDLKGEFGINVTESSGEPLLQENLPGPQQCLPFRDVDAIHSTRDGRVMLRSMQWQLIHNWNREFRSDYTNFNTRREKLDRPHNRELLCHKRCIVPVSEFFENRKEDGRTVTPKESYRFTLKGQKIIPLGGIYSIWTNPEAEEDRRYSCSVITLEPNDLIGVIHNRMPYIVSRDIVAVWLDAGITDFQYLLELIEPLAAGLMNMEREVG